MGRTVVDMFFCRLQHNGMLSACECETERRGAGRRTRGPKYGRAPHRGHTEGPAVDSRRVPKSVCLEPIWYGQGTSMLDSSDEVQLEWVTKALRLVRVLAGPSHVCQTTWSSSVGNEVAPTIRCRQCQGTFVSSYEPMLVDQQHC